MLDNFYDTIYKNLNSRAVFYRYKDEKFKYTDLKKFYKYYIVQRKIYKKKKNNRIISLFKKSFECYATSISILLTNDVWIPISSELPIERIEKHIKLLRPDVILFDRSNKKTIDHLMGVNKNIIYLEIKGFNEIKNLSISNKLKQIKSHCNNDEAMIFFTSGSTGDPKGVVIKQKNFIPSFFVQYKKFYSQKNRLTFVDFHDISFVISLNIFFQSVYSCSTIVPAKNISDFVNPLSFMRDHKVNVLITVPSFISQIMKLKIEESLNLKIVIMCGETFFYNILEFILKKLNSAEVYNCYGSTELSPWIFSYRYNHSHLDLIKKIGVVPVGRKFDFVKLKIIEEKLLISGPNVVDGYLNGDGDSKKFFKEKNVNWYLTGDKAKKIKNYFFIMGRNDDQIKIRGYRVNLLEIEKNIRKFSGITHTYVFCKNEGNYKKKILAVIDQSSEANKLEITDFLRKKLPIYMMPNKFIFMKIPCNKNGKIDRKKIKEVLKI